MSDERSPDVRRFVIVVIVHHMLFDGCMCAPRASLTLGCV